MTDDLDRLQHAIVSAALRDDGDSLRDNVQILVATCRQLRGEVAAERRSITVMAEDHKRVVALLTQAEADNAALRAALEKVVDKL